MPVQPGICAQILPPMAARRFSLPRLRFLALVAEFRREAQLLIVSHQKRTMEAGDSLLGVTMQPGGSSRVVSEKVSSSH